MAIYKGEELMTTRLILLALFLSVVASTSSADFAVTPDGQANNYQLHSPTETELQAHERNIVGMDWIRSSAPTLAA